MNNIVLIILIGVSLLFFVVIAHKKPKKPYIPKEKKPEIKRISTGKIQELQKKLDIHKVEAKTAINRTEIQIYEVLLDAFDSYNVFVSTQVSLSSLLNSEENTLWQAYKDLYADFVLFSKETGKPIYVIEYHGSGHNPSGAEYMRPLQNSFCRVESGVCESKHHRKTGIAKTTFFALNDCFSCLSLHN